MENKPSKLKSALNYGAMFGLALVVLNLLTFVLEMYDSTLMTIIGSLVGIGGLVYGIKKYRDDVCDGVISYGSALGYGVLIALFAGVIVAVGNYAYWGFVDDGFLLFKLEEQENLYYESGMPEEQIEMSMVWAEKMLTPGMASFLGIISQVFFAFIISLIAAAFLKKDPDSFDQT